MSRRLPAFALLASLAAGTALAGDPPPARGPVSVFVQARTDEAMPAKEEMEARRAKADALGQAFSVIAKDAYKKYGKDRTKWPADVRASYYKANDEQGLAWSANYYVARPAPEKADSVADIQKQIGKERKNAYLVLAPTKDEADLVLEVVGRKGLPKFMAGGKWMAIDLLPGRIPAATLPNLGREFGSWLEDNFMILHWPAAKEPFARIEVSHPERWVDVATNVRQTVEELVKANYDLLKPAK
jgi:hypothetical protein